jgi:hypothetical protein
LVIQAVCSLRYFSLSKPIPVVIPVPSILYRFQSVGASFYSLGSFLQQKCVDFPVTRGFAGNWNSSSDNKSPI